MVQLSKGFPKVGKNDERKVFGKPKHKLPIPGASGFGPSTTQPLTPPGALQYRIAISYMMLSLFMNDWTWQNQITADLSGAQENSWQWL